MPKDTAKKPTKVTKTTKKSTEAENAPELIIANTQIKLTVPLSEAKAAYDKILRKMAPQVKAAGFRKGKVPPHVAEEIIGQINIIDRSLQEVLPAIYSEQIKKDNKKPLLSPDIKPVKITMDADWELIAEIAEHPVVKLGDYKKIVATAKKDAQAEIKKMEEEVHDHSQDDHNHDEPGHEGHNHKAKPTVQPGHEGKHTHKLTDKQKEDVLLSHIFRGLVGKIKPQIQELILREKVRAELQRLEKDLKQVNLTLDDYLQKQNKTFAQFSQELAIMHLGQVQLEFILEAIVEQEKLAPTEEEIQSKIKETTAKMDKNILKEFDEEKYRPYFISVIEREKVIDFLVK